MMKSDVKGGLGRLFLSCLAGFRPASGVLIVFLGKNSKGNGLKWELFGAKWEGSLVKAFGLLLF